jgi:hypothetical protein
MRGQMYKELAQYTAPKRKAVELVGQGWLREQFTPPDFRQKEKIAYLINPKAKTR